MFVLILTHHGIDLPRLVRTWESTHRCEYDPRKNGMYHSDLDLSGGSVGPLRFDVVTENSSLHHRLMRSTKFVVVPARPDLVWDTCRQKYKNPTSAYANRLRRLYEVSTWANALTVPYHRLFTADGATAIQNFLGLAKPFKSQEAEVECGWPECPLITHYRRLEAKFAKTPGFYTRHANSSLPAW